MSEEREKGRRRKRGLGCVFGSAGWSGGEVRRGKNKAELGIRGKGKSAVVPVSKEPEKKT